MDRDELVCAAKGCGVQSPLFRAGDAWFCPDHTRRDEPERLVDGLRVCAREACSKAPRVTGLEPYGPSPEFRINGYCSCECEDMHALERRVTELEAQRENLKGAALKWSGVAANAGKEIRSLEEALRKERERADALETQRERLIAKLWRIQPDGEGRGGESWREAFIEADAAKDARDVELSSLRRVLEAAEAYKKARERWVVVMSDTGSTVADREAVTADRDVQMEFFFAAIDAHRTGYPREGK